MAGRLNGAQQTEPLHFFDNQLARRKSILARKGLRLIGEDARIGVQYGDQWQIMPFADLEIVEVMGGRNLHRARALFRIGIVIGDHRDLTAGDRMVQQLADHLRIAGVVGMNGDGGVAKQGFRSRGCDDHLTGPIGQRIGEMPVKAVDLAIFDFQIGNGRLELRVPIDQALIAIDQALVVKGDKDLAHGCRKAIIQGEALARPVATGPQSTHLTGNRAARFGFPGPNLLNKGFAPKVSPPHIARLRQLTLDHHLGRNPGMVGAGQPQDRIAAHAPIPR